MCSIVCATSEDTLKALLQESERQGRGGHSWSRTLVSYKDWTVKEKDNGMGKYPFNKDMLQVPDGTLAVAHVQAPTTTARGKDSIHPSESFSAGIQLSEDFQTFLWHNGVLEPRCYEKYADWDTKAMNIMLHEAVALSWEGIGKGDCWKRWFERIKGQFACILLVVGKGLYLFRNEAAPLYCTEDGYPFFTVSSVRAKDVLSLTSGGVFSVYFEDGVFSTVKTASFDPEGPYYL